MEPSSTFSSARTRLAALTVGAIGVVYGDIGTSPLYALKECFSSHYGLQANNTEVYGILSLVFWSLTIIICFKYLALIMRFDNKGEGGILALMELVHNRKKSAIQVGFLFILGIFGASLLYGDGIITPAISVLSAVEGLNVAAPGLETFILPIALAVLFLLFTVQKYGTGGVGKVFGPFMVFWFLLLGFLGLVSLLQTPHILQCVNPMYAVDFFAANGLAGFKVLGSVFLVVTGGETVYADMGHFGVRPIRRGWFVLVYPCLLLNYFGQGALLLREGSVASTVANPFFHLVPPWGVIPLVLVATVATIIASQAVISGAFSLTWQALQLGYLPRMKVLHTSRDERGQIYIPTLNWMLFLATVLLVLEFKTSTNLAAAYGIAVTTTMVITSILAYVAMRQLFQWPLIPSIAVSTIFLAIDGSFFTANLFKIADGGWVPLALAVVTYMLMLTWYRGRDLLSNAIRSRNLPLDAIVEHEIDRFEVVPGTALYMSGYANVAPPALISNLKYNRVRHETIILLTVDIETVAHVGKDQRFEVIPLKKNIYKVVLSYGFMDQLNLMDDLMYLPEFDIPVDITDATFVLGHETLNVANKEHMPRWRKELFVFLHRNSRTPAKHFGIPVKRTLEVGSHIAL
jgi:KUP system potassium uptake protein